MFFVHVFFSFFFFVCFKKFFLLTLCFLFMFFFFFFFVCFKKFFLLTLCFLFIFFLQKKSFDFERAVSVGFLLFFAAPVMIGGFSQL